MSLLFFVTVVAADQRRRLSARLVAWKTRTDTKIGIEDMGEKELKGRRK